VSAATNRLVAEAALVLAAVVALVMYGRAERRAGASEVRMHHADSLLADAKLQRAGVLKSNAELAARAEQHERRARIADSIAALNVARAAVVRVQRDSARAALRLAETPADSLAALAAKSAADDSVIAEQERVIAQKDRALEALRETNALLHTAVDSATAQLRRDDAVNEQLRAALRAARPSAFQRWTDRITGGVGGYLLGRLKK